MFLKQTDPAADIVAESPAFAVTSFPCHLREVLVQKQVGTVVGMSPGGQFWGWLLLPKGRKQGTGRVPSPRVCSAQREEIGPQFPEFPSDGRLGSPGSHRGLTNTLTGKVTGGAWLHAFIP